MLFFIGLSLCNGDKYHLQHRILGTYVCSYLFHAKWHTRTNSTLK